MIDLLISTHILLALSILLTIMVLVTLTKNEKDDHLDIELENLWHRVNEIDCNLANLINEKERGNNEKN